MEGDGGEVEGDGEGGATSWGGGAFDVGGVNAFLAATLSRVMRTTVLLL